MREIGLWDRGLLPPRRPFLNFFQFLPPLIFLLHAYLMGPCRIWYARRKEEKEKGRRGLGGRRRRI